MALAKLKYLDATEVAEIAIPILMREFGSYQFQDIEAQEVEDFDGENIFRVNALVGEKVPVKQVIKALSAIHVALRAKGELRFVNLSTQYRQPDETEDDEED